MTTYRGPCQIDCPLKCSVPAGYVIAEMPPTRHAFSDVKVCPNEPGIDFPEDQTCGKTLLLGTVPE